MFFTNLSGRSGRWTSGTALVMALLAGCGGSSGDDAPANERANTAPAATMVLSGLVTAGGSEADARASTGSELSLNGSTSVDAEGDTMTYKWSITSKPAASTLALASATSVAQSIKPDVAGTYVITLRVTDSKGAFSEKAVTITVRDNVAPVTNVAVTATYNASTTTKPTQGLNIGSTVVLDAKGSTDADGDAVVTTWTLVDKPTASLAGLTVDGPVSRFVADVAGTYKVRARGTDPLGAYSDTVYVFDASNTAPKSVVVTSAIAPGADGNSTVSAPAGYVVSLGGFDALSPWREATKAWVLVSKPAASAAVLASDSGDLVQITPDRLGNYVVKLTVTNSAGAMSSHLTTIEVTNRSPLAAIDSNVAPNAVATGPAVRLPLNTTVTLRSANSTDADGDTLTYAWTLTRKPDGSAAAVSSASGATVQLTADKAGSYVVLMRATDPSGAFSEQSMTFQAGSYAPVAVVDKSFATVLLGSAASASASLSFDEDSGPLTFAWAIDAAPAGSAATIAAPTTQALSFTPDVTGIYVVSVTVSDGVNTNVAYVTVRALASLVTNVELLFVPLETRYSKGLDKLLMLATNPNAVKIVDPFTSMVKTVVLPLPGKALNLSPDGKLAAVLQDGVVSLIDVETGTLVRSSTGGNDYSEVIVNNAGVAYLFGRINGYSSSEPGVGVMDLRTGTDLSATLGTQYSMLSGNYRGIFSPLKQRAYFSAGNYSSSVHGVDIDPLTGKVATQTITSSSSSSNYYNMINQLYLSENQDLVFASSGSYFRSDNLQYAGKLSYTGNMQSLSHSSQLSETLVMLTSEGNWPNYGRVYNASYKRFAGALFLPDTDLALPLIGGLQSYGIQIFHSATGKHVALVQTGSSMQFGVGSKYYVLAR